MMQTTTLSDTKRRLLDALMRGENSTAERRIQRRPASEPARLALAQEEVWRRSIRAADAPPLYNETVTIHRQGPLDVQVLERCFAEILRRHEAWRTTFPSENGVPFQLVAPAPADVKIPLIDLRQFPVEAREQEAVRLFSDQAQQPFDLERGPLLRIMLLRIDDESDRIAIVAHQSIVDGVSVYQVLPTELAALYDAFSADRLSPLPDLPLQYGDFAQWHRRSLSGENLETQRAYWRKKLSPPLRLPAWPRDGSDTVRESYRASIVSFEVPDSLNGAIQELALRERVTLFTTLLAGFTLLLHHYTGQADIVVGTVSPSGRKRLETQQLLGYFLNPVALRFDFSDEPSFRELLVQTRLLIAEAISHDDVPLEHLARDLELNTGRDPAVKIAMSLQPRVPHLNGWNVTSMDAQNGGSVWDFYLVFIESERGLIGRVQFNPDLFDEKAIDATLEDLWRLLGEAIADPTKRPRHFLRS